MSTNFEENKENIVGRLNKKVPGLKCPICGNSNLILGGGFFAHDLQQDLNQRQMGGINIPTVPTICPNCGYLMEFAVGILGLLPHNPSEGNVKPNTDVEEEKNEK